MLDVALVVVTVVILGVAFAWGYGLGFREGRVRGQLALLDELEHQEERKAERADAAV